MRSDPRLTLTLSLLAAITGRPALATPACGCPDEPFPTVLNTSPYFDIPTNARLLLRAPRFELAADTITLEPLRAPHSSTTSTHAVPIRVEATAGTLGEVWVVPLEPLEPATEYRFSVRDRASGYTHVAQPFVTRTDPRPDETPPVLSALRVVESEFFGACGAQYGAALDTTPTPVTGQPTEPAEASLLEVVIEGGRPSPQTVWVSPEAWTIGKAIDFKSCKNFEGADDSTELTATVTAYDAAGNKSEPRSTGRFRLTYSPAVFGCSATADVRDGVPPWTALLILVLGFMRSRRPRR